MDYFNEGESEKQAEFAARRDQFFAPIVGALDKMGLTPTMVSIIGVVFAIVGASVPPVYWWLSALLLCLYVLMDGLDGPLARTTGTQSQGGSLVDIFADQIGVIIVAIAAVYWLDASVVANVAFAVLYIHVIYMMVICNLVQLKLPAILRVKYFYFAVYVGSMWYGSAAPINLFAVVFGLYYLVYFFLLFQKIINGIK